jgi:hypothetical protein
MSRRGTLILLLVVWQTPFPAVQAESSMTFRPHLTMSLAFSIQYNCMDPFYHTKDKKRLYSFYL